MDSEKNATLAKRLSERFAALKGLRQPWETLWEEIARYVFPRRVPGMNGTFETVGTTNEEELFDSSAVTANKVLAAGHLAWMSPLESPWFAFEPQRGQGDEAKRWLSSATEEARHALAMSNFYTSAHEFYLDRGAFGIGAIYVEPGQDAPLNVECWPVGSFVIENSQSGLVDTVIREFKLTPRQAIQKFGEENVSEKIRKAVSEGGQKCHDKVTFLHAIYPREDAERDKAKIDAPNMPIASVYIDRDENHVCRVSGYEEMPVMVSRYLEWGSGMGGLYGWGPGQAALPEARQLNWLQKMMDALAEKAAFPPVLAPEELEGSIDANAFGVTYFSKEMTERQMPKEWMTQGRYDIGHLRVLERQKAIREIFHVDLFQMFAALDKQMTAREVAERSQEKLIQIEPTFSRLTTELFNPLLKRLFGILLRGGRFGQVPESLIQRVSETTGVVQEPKIKYTSRIALAMRSLPALGYQRTAARLGEVMKIAPEVIDNFNFDTAEREAALLDGVPAEYLRPEADVEEIRAKRSEQAAQLAQMQAAQAAADAVSKVGRIPDESAVGKVLSGNFNAQTA